MGADADPPDPQVAKAINKGDRMKAKTTVLMTVLTIFGLFTSACGGEADGTPTPGTEAIMTAAVGTFTGAMTQTALFAPTKTVTPTPSATATLFSAATLPNVTPFGTTSGTGGVVANTTASCYRLSYVADVTIPDSTPMNPGQTFTKTWKVRNTGSCAWDAGFKFAFTGGDNMQAVTYSLPQSVPANTEINISIDMTAPTNKTGNLRSNWRMSTASGQYFGDEVYVLIAVGGGAAATNTGAASGSTATTAPASATPTATTTTP
jgi:hypothetical protein